MRIDTRRGKAIFMILGIFFILVSIWEVIGGNLTMMIVYLSIGILWIVISVVFQRNSEKLV